MTPFRGVYQSKFHCSSLFHFTNLISVYRARNLQRNQTAPRCVPPFQVEGCGQTFEFSNGLRVESMRGTPPQSGKPARCVVKRVYATCFTFLFFAIQPATNSLSPGPATALLPVLHHAPLSMPTPTPNGPDFDDDTAPPQLVAACSCRGPSIIFSFTPLDAVFHPTYPHLA